MNQPLSQTFEESGSTILQQLFHYRLWEITWKKLPNSLRAVVLSLCSLLINKTFHSACEIQTLGLTDNCLWGCEEEYHFIQ